MHILFLTDNFPPEVNAPASRTFEHCRQWSQNGHQVTVITCAPNFPKGKVYEGYRNALYQREEMKGIQVVRVWTYITANEGVAKRILDYSSFMIAATIAALFIRKPSLVVATSPQFFTACAGYLVSRFKRIPYVFELRDMWPESIKAVGVMKDSVLIRLFERLELFLYNKADLIISVTQSFKRILVTRGVKEEKIHVITNGVDIKRYSQRPKDKELLKRYNLEDTFIVGYIGTHGMAHALETILEAAEQLQKSGTGSDIRFLFLGHGAKKEALLNIAEQKKLKNVCFINSVSKEEVVRYWSILDVSAIHLKKAPLFATVIPSKLFECMGMGIPILHGVHGESATIVQKEDVGIVFEPENSNDLLEKLFEIKNDPARHEQLRKNCLKSAGKFDRSKLAASMAHELEQIIE